MRARPLDLRTVEWAARERRLSRSTLEAMRVVSGTAFFPALGDSAPAILFPYGSGFKARAITSKDFVASKGFETQFWNLDAVLRDLPERVFIVEGELDACALVEAGIPVNQVLSVPGGAKKKTADTDREARGYSFVIEAQKAGLGRLNKFVFCGDGDDVGLGLRADLGQILGAARFYFVDWPEGCKDANDLLRTDGPAALHDRVVNGALPWPVDGLYRLADLPELPPLQPWEAGFLDWEGHIRLAPSTWSVVTGQPGHGKTVLWQQVWYNIVREYGVTAAICSFETGAKPHLRRHLRSFFNGCLERQMRDEEIRAADAWINERYLFMVHPEEKPTLRWLLDMAEVAVVRHGARIIQLDPWNRLESQRPGQQSETDYIGECLREVHKFAKDFNCHVQILAHPAKPDSKRRGLPPTLDEISGSKHWDNMADQGFVVHRPSLFDGSKPVTECEVYCRKARFEALGHPCSIKMKFDLSLGRYVGINEGTLV